MRQLTDQEKQTNVETTKHIYKVAAFLDELVQELRHRQESHDASKLRLPEVEVFAKYTPLLASTTYGSDKYKQCLTEMKEGALDHHYSVNRHHPEHFENGISDMNLVDLLEMLCDWNAAALRHADGDINKSIDHNKGRFNVSDQLTKIFQNTVRDFGW